MSSASAPQHSESTKCHVRFDVDKVDSRDIEALQDMTTEEKGAKWYMRQEFDEMEAECDKAFQLMMSGEDFPEFRGHCYRGLEQRKQEEYNRKQGIQSFAERSLQAVLKEQRRQAVASVSEPHMLATIYSAYATLCANQAARQGQADYEEAYDKKDVVTTNAIGLPTFLVVDGANGDSDDQSVNSDLSMDESIANPRAKSVFSKKNGPVMVRIKKMMDRTRLTRSRHG